MEFLKTIVLIWNKYDYVFLEGLIRTLQISFITVLTGTVMGVFIALLKMSKNIIIKIIINAYIEIIRGTPILLQMYFFWLGVPKMVPFDLPDSQWITMALIVNASAYISEIIRAGIQAVDKGQGEAARSVGMNKIDTMRVIILPQAIKNILPALGNEFITMIKGTSLASVFFLGELTTAYKTISSATYLVIPPLAIAGLIYLVVNYTLSILVNAYERKLKVGT